MVRPAAPDALSPGLGQTRTAGLVILPGVCVSMPLGGAPPALTEAVQAESVTLTVEPVAQGQLHRAEPDRT